jgi:hypothetical protein
VITLYRPGRLGDVVLLGAVTSALGRCRVATSPRYHEVARRLRGVVDVVAHDAIPAGVEVVDLQGGLRGRRRFPWARRIRKRSVRRRLWRRLGAPPLLRRPDVPSLYGEALGVVPVGPPWIDRPPVERDTLVLVPGAAWGPKRPSLDWLASCAEGADRIVVLGGPGEEALVAELAGRTGGEGLVENGFAQTLAVLARAHHTVGGDTGLLHLAGALGCRLTVWFGPTHPDDGFFVYPGRVVQRPLACRPCALHRIERCWRGDHACRDVEPACAG